MCSRSWCGTSIDNTFPLKIFGGGGASSRGSSSNNLDLEKDFFSKREGTRRNGRWKRDFFGREKRGRRRRRRRGRRVGYEKSLFGFVAEARLPPRQILASTHNIITLPGSKTVINRSKEESQGRPRFTPFHTRCTRETTRANSFNRPATHSRESLLCKLRPSPLHLISLHLHLLLANSVESANPCPLPQPIEIAERFDRSTVVEQRFFASN